MMEKITEVVARHAEDNYRLQKDTWKNRIFAAKDDQIS
jgi:hypothetical protein